MSDNERPLIFIGNDDGYVARGLNYLVKIAREYGDVIVAAPATHQSGKSSALTVDVPLRAHKVKEEAGLTVYCVNGTPVDCIKLAMNKLVARKPDVVLSGINHGYNSGNSAIYSGTMGVAFEGSFLGVPSIGFSYGDYSNDADFSVCGEIVRKFIGHALAGKLQSGLCYNINIPKCEEVKGLKAVGGASGHWTEEFEERIDPHGFKYYWLTGKYVPDAANDESTDLYWLNRGYATVTPCRADQTARDALAATAALD